MASRLSTVKEIFTSSPKVGLTKFTFLAYILPPFVGQYLMGVLVQLEGTRLFRWALLPITVWLAWRATSVDVSGGGDAPVNVTLVIQMYAIATRSAVWAFARAPYRRVGHDRTDDKDRSDQKSASIYTACWNTLDLLMNPRGIGWNWPRGLILPKPAYETRSRIMFVLESAARVAFNAVALDACVQSVHFLSPETFGSLNGGPLFDGSLPPVAELVRAAVVSTLGACMAYFGLQYTHQLLALVSVGVFRQHPSQWPPLFDAPWLSTSLGELWGRRWHQMMRDMVLTLGGEPFDRLFGRLGGVLGAFLVSGIFHDVELWAWGEDRDGRPGVVVGFWVMNGVGVVLERVWQRRTGRRVGGAWGQVWMAGWLLLWGVPAVDGYARVGRLAAMRLPGGFEPSLALVAFVRGYWWQ